MPNARQVLLLIVVFGFYFPPAFAVSSDVQVSSETKEKTLRADPLLPLSLQVGLDSGLLDHATTIPNEGPYSGYLIGGKALASLEFEDWIVESGLGFHYSALYGTTKESNPLSPEIGHRIYTQSAFAEAGLRLRLHPRFNVGLVVQDYFGADLSLSQRRGLVNNMLLGGAAASVDFLGDSGVFRLGAQLLGEVLDNQRKVIYYGATLQFGIPIIGSDTLVRQETVTIRKERIEKVVVPKVVTKTVIREVSKYSVPLGAFNFSKGSGRLNLDDSSLVTELGRILSRFSKQFRTVTIEARVRKSRRPRRDLKLSQERADSIKNTIVSLGLLSASQVSARGLGGHPTVGAHRNARFSLTAIDLSFVDLENETQLRDALTQFFTGRKTPETCRGGQCK